MKKAVKHAINFTNSKQTEFNSVAIIDNMKNDLVVRKWKYDEAGQNHTKPVTEKMLHASGSNENAQLASIHLKDWKKFFMRVVHGKTVPKGHS